MNEKPVNDIASGHLPANSQVSESLPAEPLATLIRANEMLAGWVGNRLGSGREVTIADLQAEWEAAKAKAKKEKDKCIDQSA